MSTSHVPVDLFNPGQVFACLGLAEVAQTLHGAAEACFSRSEGALLFSVRTRPDRDPIADVLGFLGEASVVSLAPPADERTEDALSTARWGVDTAECVPDDPYPFPSPSSPATLPARLAAGAHAVQVDHWGDGTVRDNVKFWGGAGGYPGAALLRDALNLARPHLAAALADPFNLGLPQSSSFRFDWRRDYVPMDIGFSLNNHKGSREIKAVGYPLVEVLAAIGMTNARPLRPEPRNKLLYRYAVPMDTWLPLPLLRPALGCAPLPFPVRTFRVTLDWPGQENQARCITHVIEETTP